MQISKVHALISLLEDPTLEVRNEIKAQLIQMGTEVIPALQKAGITSGNHFLFDDIQKLIDEIRFQETQRELAEWGQSYSQDLLEGVYLINRYLSPNLSFEDLNESIDRIAQSAWLEINDSLTILEKVNVINHVLFKLEKFSINDQYFHSPTSYLLDHLIKSKKGNHISVGILYYIIANKLGLSLKLIENSEYFFLAYYEKNKILFLINPLNKGELIGPQQLEQLNSHLKSEIFIGNSVVKSNVVLLKRLILGLVNSYDKVQDGITVTKLNTFLNILNT